MKRLAVAVVVLGLLVRMVVLVAAVPRALAAVVLADMEMLAVVGRQHMCRLPRVVVAQAV